MNPFATSNFSSASVVSSDGEMWSAQRWSRRGVVMVSSLQWFESAATPEHTDPSPSDLMPYWFQRKPLIDKDDMVIRGFVAYAWPLVALRYECHIPDGEPITSHCTGINTGFAPWREPITSKTFDRRIPCRPIWRGLGVNALLYASFAWLLFGGLPALRRYSRRRHGRCPKCAYDLKADLAAGCPECGWRREGSDEPKG